MKIESAPSLTLDDLDAARRGRLPNDQKICPYEDMPRNIYELKALGHRVVLVQGVFDVFHIGHVNFIDGASRHGLVVVGVENDQSVKNNKGEERPLHPAALRMGVLAAMKNVALVFCYPDTPQYDQPELFTARYNLLKADLAVPQGDPNLELKRGQAAEAEISLVHIPGVLPTSTTSILARLGS